MENGQKQKQPYVKPEIRKIELRPEEAVLGNCKMQTAAGPFRSRCTTFPGGCFTIGT
jgi:hypothetical protein